MASVKILHSADMHIGATESFLGVKSKERQSETLMTFEKSVRLAKEENVALYLIAGDLFDSLKVDYSYFRRIVSIIAEYSDIRFVYAAGNHDPYSPANPLREMNLPDNLYIFDTKDDYFTFENIKTRVYGRSFSEVCDTGERNFSIKPPADDFVNIMCIHGDVAASSEYNPIMPGFIENSYMDYIALGHIHKRTEPKILGGTYYAYSGCMESQGFDESGEKGVYIGEVTKSGVDLKFYPISNRTHIRENVDVSGSASSADASNIILDFLQSKYGEKYADNLYKITLNGKIPDGVELSTKEITVRLLEKVYFAKVKDKTTADINLELLSEEPTLKGIFVKKMLEKIASAEDGEKQKLEYALSIGLKAFVSEVDYNED